MTTPSDNKPSEENGPPSRSNISLEEKRAADREARRHIEEANREAQERQAAYEARVAERNAVLRAEAEEKEAARQQKADAKSKAAKEKAEAREEAARLKAQSKEAAEKEKAEAKAKKEEEADRRAEKKAELKAFKERLRDEARRQTKTYGAPLAELVALFLRAFSKRGDIAVLAFEEGEKAELDLLLKHQELPVETLLWYSRAAGLLFRWGWESGGAPVGELRVSSLQELVSDDSGDGAPEFARIQEHVSRGLIPADASEALKQLRSNSALRYSTTGCLLAALSEKGFEPKAAETLVTWLGEGARLLFSRMETEEGRRREEVLAATSETETDVDRSSVDVLNLGPALEKRDLKRLVTGHEAFLERGTPEGSFEVKSKRGVPFVTFRSEQDTKGQAIVCCENITGGDFRKANLSFSGLVGVRAEKVSFASADLSHSCLRHSTLTGAKFSNANLVNCDFSDSNLDGADFRGADLTGTNFERTSLIGASFAGAKIAGTKFGFANMRAVKY